MKEGIRGVEEKDSHPKGCQLEGTSPNARGKEAMTNTAADWWAPRASYWNMWPTATALNPQRHSRSNGIPRQTQVRGGKDWRTPSVRALSNPSFARIWQSESESLKDADKVHGKRETSYMLVPSLSPLPTLKRIVLTPSSHLSFAGMVLPCKVSSFEPCNAEKRSWWGWQAVYGQELVGYSRVGGWREAGVRERRLLLSVKGSGWER